MKRTASIRLTLLLNLIFGSVSLLFCIVMVIWVNYEMKQQALRQAQTNSRLILDHNIAIHTYFSEIMKPTLLQWSRPFRDKDYFEPSWMSSTYAVREIDRYFQQFSPYNYYYKECAINARSESNEADTYEKNFIKKLNKDPDLIEKTDIRTLNGVPYFVSLRRGETMEKSCLLCHSTPDQSPRGLVAIYGSERSYHRKVGDVVSAISIRIPLQEAYDKAESFSFNLSILSVFFIILLFLCHSLLNHWLIFHPLATIRKKTLKITNDPSLIGEQIASPAGKELYDLTSAFNHMSLTLQKQINDQESIIQNRTESLSRLNQNLSQEIERRASIEKQQEKLIAELKQALAKVKQLSGLLPICSSCKKIRDDTGYWQQIESYIHDHSEAEFTHSLCEECAKKYFPDFKKRRSTE